MPISLISDRETRKQLACIEDGQIFNAETKKLIATFLTEKSSSPMCVCLSLGELKRTGEDTRGISRMLFLRRTLGRGGENKDGLHTNHDLDLCDSRRRTCVADLSPMACADWAPSHLNDCLVDRTSRVWTVGDLGLLAV